MKKDKDSIKSKNKQYIDNAEFLKAMIVSLLLLLLYITLSFQFAFAVGAIVGIVHDALIVLTFFILVSFL